MNFGLDSFISWPMYGAFLSLNMIAGLDAIGLFFLKFMRLGLEKEKANWLRCQSPILGAAILLFFVFPATLAGILSRDLAMAIGYALAVCGLLHASTLFQGYSTYLNLKRLLKNINTLDFTLIVFIICFVLIALAPITDADSLDYHVGVAIDILNLGTFPFRPEWFHGRLAGSGEVLIAIGLSVGAEQFSALLQVVGILSVASLFLLIPGAKRTTGKWLTLVFVSSPVLLALAASAKPMLLPISMTTTALILVQFCLYNVTRKRSVDEVRHAFILVCLLTMVATTMKLNFLLSGGIVTITAMFLLFRSRFGFTAIVICSLMACLIMLPIMLWRSQYFGGSILMVLLQPFPGNWPGVDAFRDYLLNYRDTALFFPLTLIIPATFATVTTVLGIIVTFLISSLHWHKFHSRAIVVATILLLIGGFLLGQLTSRFFLEPCCWVLAAYHLKNIEKPVSKFLESSTLKLLISIQAYAVLAMLIFGVYKLSPGTLSLSWRKEVMQNSAQGYDLMSWVDKVLPPKVTLISGHRSVALSPREVIATDWINHVTEGGLADNFYWSIIAPKRPEFMLVTSRPGVSPKKFSCTNEIFAGP